MAIKNNILAVGCLAMLMFSACTADNDPATEQEIALTTPVIELGGVEVSASRAVNTVSKARLSVALYDNDNRVYNENREATYILNGTWSTEGSPLTVTGGEGHYRAGLSGTVSIDGSPAIADAFYAYRGSIGVQANGNFTPDAALSAYSAAVLVNLKDANGTPITSGNYRINPVGLAKMDGFAGSADAFPHGTGEAVYSAAYHPAYMWSTTTAQGDFCPGTYPATWTNGELQVGAQTEWPIFEVTYSTAGFNEDGMPVDGGNVTTWDVNYTGQLTLDKGKLYAFTITLSLAKATITLDTPDGKPGWGTTENELSNAKNDAKTELSYASGTFSVSGPSGLQYLNKWMMNGITTDDFKAIGFNGADGINATAGSAEALAMNITFTADITLDALAEGESNWKAIGTSEAPYTGTIDGNGYTLSGMVINATAAYQGFVGYLGTNGKIKNLTFADAELSTTENIVGIVAGFINEATVENCHTMGTSSVNGVEYVGGIVGWAVNSTITGCINAATVQSTVGDAAGIVGKTEGTIVIACGNTGEVSGAFKSVGGIVGYSYGGMNIASWTIDTTEIDSWENAVTDKDGYGDLDGYVTNEACYSATGADEAAQKAVLNSKLDEMNGALRQYYKDNSTTTGLFWKESTSGWPTVVQQEVSGENPHILDLKFIEPIDPTNSDGTFEVGNAEGLMLLNEWMMNKITKDEFKATGFEGSDKIVSNTSAMKVDITLTNDITLPTVGEGESNWTPIGGSSNVYTGTFDGNNKTIRNLAIVDLQYTYGFGLIGYLSGKVKNVALENVKIDSRNSNVSEPKVGGIVGQIQKNAQVSGCTVSGIIRAGGSALVGGIAGKVNESSSISYCVNTATIEGIVFVGGIVGINTKGSVTQCINHGEVKRTESTNQGHVGGIVGKNDGGFISNCENKGYVESVGNVYLGGIVGYFEGGGTVENCINNAPETATQPTLIVDATTNRGSFFGGIVGFSTHAQCKVIGCINHADMKYTSHNGDGNYSVGGIVGWMNQGLSILACGNTGDINLDLQLGSKNLCVGGICGYNYDKLFYGCWTSNVVEYRFNREEAQTDRDGFGSLGNSNSIKNCYSAASKSNNETEKAYINNKVRDMNTAISSATLPEGVTRYYWVADTDGGWPTLTTKEPEPASPAQGN